MPRKSRVHYIAPSAISMTPNANGTINDIAVNIARGTKIKVLAKKAGIDYENNTFQEWSFSGRNRRLEIAANPYTIYARLNKTKKTDGYLVFAPKRALTDNKWGDKYNYVTTEGLTDIEGATTSNDYWYIRLGDVSMPDGSQAGKRTLTFDTGILGTDEYNTDWGFDPDDLPLRIEFLCTVDDQDAGPTPYVPWGKTLRLKASLVEGWADADIPRFDHWQITRNTNDPDADGVWPGTARQAAFAPLGAIDLTHARGVGDDFNGAVSSLFTVTAWGVKDEEEPSGGNEEEEENVNAGDSGSQDSGSGDGGDSGGSGEDSGDETEYVPLAQGTITIMAETVEKFELALSTAIVSFDPRTGEYTPDDGVGVRIRATDQRSDAFYLTRGQYDSSNLTVQYAPIESENWTTVTFGGAATATAVGNIPVSAFHAQKSVNVRIVRITGNTSPIHSASEPPSEALIMELTRQTIAFVRDGEDSSDREWIFFRSQEAITFGDASSAHPKPSLITVGQVRPSGAAGGTTPYDSTLDEWVPEGWWDEEHGVDETYRFEYGAYRDYVRGDTTPGAPSEHWGPFTDPTVWNHWGKDAVTYDIVPSVSVINANAEGEVDSDGIIVMAYRTEGATRSGNILPEDDYPQEGAYYYAEYSIDGNAWQLCVKFRYPSEESETGYIYRYGIPAAAVKSAREDVTLRLKHSDSPGTVLKENAPIKVVKIMSEDEIVALASRLFLSKVHDDTAKGRITFEKGLEFLTTILSIDSEGNKAIPGFMGGRGIHLNANEGLIETDGLHVRGFMRIMELVINRLQLMDSDYSFTEGGDVEHIGYEDNGQTLVLTMHKRHDNDYTPFYPGDILYGKVNDLLPKDSPVPDGHTPTKNGSYYTTWLRVKSVDLTNNILRVTPYAGKKPSGSPMVPGGSNFSPYGTQLKDDDITAEMLAEYNTPVDPEDPASPTLGEVGYDTMLTLTRHGNVADGIDPETGQFDQSILLSQQGRQQAWVLSTTDKRLSFFWNVDEPIVRDENYALCLGLLPELANLPSTRNRTMPSLYVNTVFYDHQHRANYPAKVVKVDRGQWINAPSARYTGQYAGTYTPDGTLVATDPDLAQYLDYIPVINGYAGTYAVGQLLPEPYHLRTITMDTWLSYRLDTAHYGSRSDKQLLLAMLEEWREEVELETSRVWKNGILWECLVDGTAHAPELGCSQWQVVSGDTVFWIEFQSSNGSSFYQGHVNTVVTARLWWGSEDVTSIVGALAFTWTRSSESGKTDADRAWDAQAGHSGTNILTLTDADMPTAWSRNNKAIFTCTVTYNGQEVAENTVIA